jgi:hypothetical protein
LMISMDMLLLVYFTYNSACDIYLSHNLLIICFGIMRTEIYDTVC